ncbi:MAG: hypothetical protein KDK41_02895 [Leptospiraceae bacterium]|nr:hypothetical protein [Leptospiraceae bacterium]
MRSMNTKSFCFLLVSLITIQFVFLSCGSSQEKAVFDGFERSRSIAVIYALPPVEKFKTPAIVYEGGPVHQQLPANFKEVEENVKNGIAASWPVENIFIPESNSQFTAELVAGVHVLGRYERTKEKRFQLILEAWLVFKNERMNKFIGNENGYLIATVKSKDLSVPEYDDYIESKRVRNAFEQLLRYVPVEPLLPELKSEIEKGTAETVARIRKAK